MKIPSSQRQPLNKTNGGGGVMEETSFSGQTEWEGLHSVGWRGMRIAVSLPINTRVSYGLTWKILSISVLVFSQLDCKGYCLCSDLHSLKGSCLQSRFLFLFWGYLCISVLPQNCCCGIAEQNMHPVQGVSFGCEILNLIVTTYLFFIIGEGRFLYGSSHLEL